MSPEHRIPRFIIAAVTVIGLVTAIGKSLGDFRKLGDDRTVTAAPLPVPTDSPRQLHPWKELDPTTQTGSIAGIITALGLMLASGYFAAALLFNAPVSPAVRLLLLGMSVPLGFALHSTAAFALMLSGRLNNSTLIMSVPIVNFAIIGAWLLLRMRNPVPNLNQLRDGSLSIGTLVVAIVLMIACCAGPITKRLGGDWDALYFWNARAASLLCAGHDWRWAYDGTIDPAYNDYPLCLPLTIAIVWSFAGQMTFIVPLAISIISLFSIAIILHATVRLLDSQLRPISAALLFASLPALGRVVAGQRADLLMTAGMLGSMAALTLSLLKSDDKYLGLCLPLAACAAWTKNEGLAILALMVLLIMFYAVQTRIKIGSSLRRCALFAVPIVAAIIALKINVSHANDLWTYSTTSGPVESSFVARSMKIISAFAGRMFNYLYLPYFTVVMLCIMNLRKALTRGFAIAVVLLGMIAIYFVVFLVTPRDLEWHLEHSEKRLMVHLWPLWILLLNVVWVSAEKNEKSQLASLAATKA